VERCIDCGRLAERLPDDDDLTCAACGGELVPLRVAIGREAPTPPTSGEELTGRLVGIGA
jgi:hypothetical protein